jgi:hypothetical protein
MNKWLKAIIYLIGSALLTRWVPFSAFFRNVDTMVHESGHAIVTLLMSGSVMNISLYEDHSGVTRSYVSGNMTLIPVALAGYVTASLFAWLLFSLYARRKYTAGILIISILALLSLVLFVRNSYGVLWLCGFLLLSVIILFAPDKIQKYYFLLIAFLSLEESAFGPLTLLLTALQAPSRAGDAAVLAGSTSIPAVIWAAGFLLFALWCAKNAVQAFLGRGRYRSASNYPSSIHD